MENDQIRWGESYDLSITAQDADGNAIALDETWSGKYRVLTGNGSGTEIEAGALAIADGVATATIDTGAGQWIPGIYYYDVRLTDPDGYEYPSETVRLRVVATQTEPN